MVHPPRCSPPAYSCSVLQNGAPIPSTEVDSQIPDAAPMVLVGDDELSFGNPYAFPLGLSCRKSEGWVWRSRMVVAVIQIIQKHFNCSACVIDRDLPSRIRCLHKGLTSIRSSRSRKFNGCST